MVEPLFCWNDEFLASFHFSQIYATKQNQYSIHLIALEIRNSKDQTGFCYSQVVLLYSRFSIILEFFYDDNNIIFNV